MRSAPTPPRALTPSRPKIVTACGCGEANGSTCAIRATAWPCSCA
jgi:hypothetical protein